MEVSRTQKIEEKAMRRGQRKREKKRTTEGMKREAIRGVIAE